MDRMIGYQYNVTGATGYYFYKGEKLLCKISTGIFFPIGIMGMGREWRSEFDYSMTICPGVSRIIEDSATGETVAKITYVSHGRYRIGDLMDVECTNGKDTFLQGGKEIASIVKLSGDEDVWIPEEGWLEFEPFFELKILEEIDDSTLLLIAGFPAMKFGLS